MPDYYDGVYEMEELLKAQSKGLYQFDEKINRTLLNEFIIQADEKVSQFLKIRQELNQIQVQALKLDAITFF